MVRRNLASACLAVSLALAATGSVSYAQGPGGNDQGQNDDSQGQKDKDKDGKPNPKATPEVDPTLLYGLGIAGLAGAGLVIRGRRGRRTDNLEIDS